MSDKSVRRAIVEKLGTSFLVEAAAGTGKTTVLVDRLVEVLARGGDVDGGGTIDRVVAVTFTNKAAGELKLRLREKLDEARTRTQDERRRGNLSNALARLEEATIGTIHSLCAEILRRRPVEARIDPAFTEIDAEEAEALYATAFQEWVEPRLEDLPEGLSRALSRLATQRSFDGRTPLERLCDAGRQLVEWRDFPAPWARRPFDRVAAVHRALEQIAGVADLYRGSDDPKDPLRQAIAPAWELDEWVRQSRLWGGDDAALDPDGLEARIIETLRALRRHERKSGRGSWPQEGLSRRAVVARRDVLIDSLESFRVEADADLAWLLREELTAVVARYGELKARAGRLDFLDLLLRARDLVRDDDEVRRTLQASFSHIFVDEFQDTDPLQIELLLLLAADAPEVADWRAARPVAGKLFLVGDPKQSIYRFRRADVVHYKAVKEMLAAAGVAVETMSSSWRSVAELQTAVNASFADEMDGDERSGQPDYVPLETPADAREPPDGRPALVALPVPRPYNDWGRITGWKLEAEQPEALAAWIHWLLHRSGWDVWDPEAEERVPIRPRHIAVLFRRFLAWGRDVTRPYLAALEARGIPHLLSGGRSFHQREEVETLRAALAAIEWPDDDLSVFATLKGALFALPDGLLWRYNAEVGRLHPFAPVPDDLDPELRPVAEAMGELARLHRQRNRIPVARTLQSLLSTTRAHAGFAMRPAGNQVLANVQRVIDRARTFDLRGGLSFRGFVQRLDEESARPSSTESPMPEEGAEGVRLMTVHSAKGLEFPVVALADITAALSRRTPGSFVDPQRQLCAMRILGCAPRELVDNTDLEIDRDRAESARVAYVAATRAREVLVVPAVGEYPWEDGWTAPLNRVLYPARERYRRAGQAPSCPQFGARSVLDRPQRAHGETEVSVRPGLHRTRGDTEVVWWDPAALELGVTPNFGLRQEELLRDDSAGAEAGAREYRSWCDARSRSQLRGSRPRYRVTLASEALEPAPPTLDVSAEHVERRDGRPTGRRFGTLVHTVLRDIAFDADAGQIERLTRFQARLLGNDESEVSAAAEAVARTLAHPRWQAAAAAAPVFREAPFTRRAADGAVVEGVIDLLYAEPAGGWTIVDFKTDAETGDLIERYGGQVGGYADAVEQLLGGPVRAVLLSV